MKKINRFIRKCIKTLYLWCRRAFFGAGHELSRESFLSEELTESPLRMTVKAFFRRKIAVAALIILICMFLFALIGPAVYPIDLSYTDPNQANIEPCMDLMSIPKKLRGDIKSISGISNFSVGLSNEGTLYIWGNTKDKLNGIDYADFPEGIAEGNVSYAAAGSDHIIAITKDGSVIGWGNKNNGQYGALSNPSEQYIQMPDELLYGTINAADVKKLICGYQCTALLMNDGTLYMWGNGNAMISLKDFIGNDELMSGVADIAFSNYYAVIIKEDGSINSGKSLNLSSQSAVSSKGGRVKNLKKYLEGRQVVSIAAGNDCYALVTDDGDLLVFGAAGYGEKDIPEAAKGEKFVSVSAGGRHFAALTEGGKVYIWGHNDSGQCDLNGELADNVFLTSKQTYLTDEDGRLTDSSGLKGYIMGTDGSGRDIFTRIIHGGRMTMTIGAVAVIVSTVIAVIIGCISGYFGGAVDILLMRLCEVFASIPFLPFAMMLSYIIRTMAIPETARIFIIMVMLGLLSWPSLARIIRAQVLAEREKEFVIAAKAMGVKERFIAFRHILPNVISVIIVSVTLDFAGCMLIESSLSYLGFGVQQPRPTWGNMLSGANNSIIIQNYWWQWVFPSLFLALATISINIIGDTLRDVLDPRSNSEK